MVGEILAGSLLKACTSMRLNARGLDNVCRCQSSRQIMCIGIYYNVSTTDQKLTDRDPVMSEIRKIVL